MVRAVGLGLRGGRYLSPALGDFFCGCHVRAVLSRPADVFVNNICDPVHRQNQTLCCDPLAATDVHEPAQTSGGERGERGKHELARYDHLSANPVGAAGLTGTTGSPGTVTQTSFEGSLSRPLEIAVTTAHSVPAADGTTNSDAELTCAP